MKEHQDTTLLCLWRFVRGDQATPDFERWANREPNLEQQLGGDLYREVVTTDFSNADAVRSIREALARHAQSQAGPACLCVRLRDSDIVDMRTFKAPAPAFEKDRQWSHQDVFKNLAEFRSRGDPYWWLWAARCRICGQEWLVGSEERQNDIFCMRRLDAGEVHSISRGGRWPSDFDTYESLLRIGLHAGKSLKFLDPEELSQVRTIADLAKERPGISVCDLATLLNLDTHIATKLARRAVEGEGVEVTFATE